MENAHVRLISQWFLGIVGAIALLASGGAAQAAILYGAGAHEKTYTVTLTESEPPHDQRETLGSGVLGIFLSVEDLATKKPVTPEILVLPCIKGSRCVTISVKEDVPVKGLLSFLNLADERSIDGASADAITDTVRTFCDRKKASSRYQVLEDVVYPDAVVHARFVGTCTYEPPKETGRATFSIRGFSEAQ